MKGAGRFIFFAIIVASGCSEPSATGDEGSPENRVVVSNIVSASSPAAFSGISAKLEETIAYISTPPGTFTGSTRAEIVNLTRSLVPLTVQVADGGFDPVAVPAGTGDSVRITPFDADRAGEPVFIRVPPRRAPVIVRSRPPKGRTDVALNVVIAVIFSEPLNTQSITDQSFRLLKSGNEVSGRIQVSNEGWEIEFIPDVPLDPFATYTVMVDGIRDLDGEALSEKFSSTFTTGYQCTPGEAGCGSSATNTVNGSVVQTLFGGRTPMPDALVTGWIESADGSSVPVEHVNADAQGHFRLTGLSNGRIHLFAVRPGFSQTCGVSAELTGNGASVDVELSPSGLSFAQLPSRAPNVTGYILELTPDPDRGGLPLLAIPVAGVRVTFESPEGRTSMATVSDPAGQFSLCNAPLGNAQVIIASKAGFQSLRYPLTTTSLSANRGFDLFITRSQSP
jgi:hypothetical protein